MKAGVDPTGETSYVRNTRETMGSILHNIGAKEKW
jgi:hypothetical protein